MSRTAGVAMAGRVLGRAAPSARHTADIGSAHLGARRRSWWNSSVSSSQVQLEPATHYHGGVIVPGVILSGGRSSRMGRPKALLATGAAETFVARVARTLREGGVDGVVVVAPDEELAIELRCAVESDAQPARVVVNPDPSRGQLSSLLIGLRAIDRPGVDAMLVTLVDIPLVSAHTVQRLIEAYRRSRAPVVRPAQAGRPNHGHPVLFDRALFGELREADLATGAKSVVRAHLNEVLDVPVDDPGAFLDIDTPDAYARAFGKPIPGDDSGPR